MKRRKIGYDYIRIVACFMVLVNHTFGETLGLVAQGYTHTGFWGNYIFFSSKMDVVSFVLISGALLLDKQESYKDWWNKRLLRIILVILVFSAIYYDWTTGNIRDYLQSAISSNLTNAFWYLFMYLGLMVTLPLLRKMCQGLENKDYILVIVILMFTQGIYPILSHYLGFPDMQGIIGTMFSYYVSWFAVFIIGDGINKYLDKHTLAFNIKHFLMLFVGWFIGNLIPTYVTYREVYYHGDTSLFMDNPFFPWSFGATICLGGMFMMIADKFKGYEKWNKVVAYISGLTFGIYLLGDKLIEIAPPYFEQWDMNLLVKLLIIDVIIFTIGAIITIILKQIPLIRKLL